MESEKTRFDIVMFPWLAHGHIFPFLELAKRLLIRKNFHIYFCTTAINFSSINNFLEKNSLRDSIELLEIHLEPSSELPPHYHTTKNLPLKLNFPLIKAFQTAKSSFSDIVRIRNPHLVIYDGFQPWAARIASSQGIPSVHFRILSAATCSVMHHQYMRWNNEFPSPEICLQEHEKKSVEALYEFVSANVFDGDKDAFFVNYKISSDIVLLKTSRGLEEKYIDYISSVTQKKMVPVGPLVNESDGENSDIIEWLNKKTKHSTVYISFGSECFLSKQELSEIAKGLEICDVNFIWVVRFAIGETIGLQEALPQGFLDRVKDRGIVVLDWAPQANILAHPNTGAFVSHCGWSSLTESVYFGVPIIGMPMHLTMGIDARMLQEAGVCLEIPKIDEMFYGEEIARVVNEVLVEKSGEKLRIRVRELSETMKMEEGREMDETAEHLWRLCLKNKQQGV